MQLGKDDASIQAITTSPPGHDSNRSTDFSEKALSDNEHADNEPVNTDPEQAQPPARIEVEPPPDGGYGWICVLAVFLINAHTWGINSVRFRSFQTIECLIC